MNIKCLLMVAIGSLSVAGCGSSSSDGGLNIKKYDLEAYSDRSLSVGDQTLAGVWVGVNNYTIQTNSATTSNQEGSSLKAFIIKQDGEGYSVGDCYGDYEAASVSNNTFNIGTKSFALNSNTNFTYEFNGTLDRGFFTEDHDVQQTYIKISDSIHTIGSYVRNWSDLDGDNSSEVTCAYTANSSGVNSEGTKFTKKTFRVGSEDGNATIRLGAGFNEYDAYIEGGELTNAFSLIYSGNNVSLSVGEVSSDGFNADFDAFDVSGLSVVGRVLVSFPFE